MEAIIYITEDEENIRELLRCTVENLGHQVRCFETAEDMLAAVRTQIPTLILLDIMLPGMDGIAALKLLRRAPETAGIQILLLTAKSGEVDKVRGLDCGADDYITKPFSVLELSARIRAALRRTGGTAPDTGGCLTGKHVCLDIQNREVRVDGQLVELTLKEFELLRILMESGRLVEREELLNRVWGYDYVGESRTLDMHVKTLRAKLGDSADAPRYIKTVRGVGYRFIG